MNIKIRDLSNRKLSSDCMKKIKGGEKLCLCSCQLGADQAKGDEWAHNRLNPPQQELQQA